METKVVLFVVALSLMVTIALGAVPKTPSLDVSPATDAVDVGIVITFTCVKDPADSGKIQGKFYIDSTTEITGETVIGAVYTPSTATAHVKKQITCKATNSEGPSAAASAPKDLTVTAIPVPTFQSSIPPSDGKVTVKNGATVTLTCGKNSAAKQDPVKFKFYEGANEITTTTTGAAIAAGELTVTASSFWKGKVIKCTHWNTDAAKMDSTTTFTLEVNVPDPPTIDFTKKLTVGNELKVTCKEKSGTEVKVTNFEIYKEDKKLVNGLTSSKDKLNDIYTKEKVTIADDNGKKFKCRANGAEGFSEYSTEETLVVEAGAASQLVSMTTMALVLALGAFFKE